MPPLFPALAARTDRPALRFGTGPDLTYARLAGAAGALAAELAGRLGAPPGVSRGRIAVWATPTAETAVGVVAALLAGVEAVPLNPRSGERELAHIVADCAPELVLAAPDVELPAPLAALPYRAVDLTAPPVAPPAEPTDDEAPALIVYTSGTTGPPKGAVLPRRAVAATLDGLAEAWRWTEADVVVHALPLFHVHGLILGVLGPLRRGGALRHLGRFTTDGVARELTAGGTVLFGVPTMYHRIAEALAAGDEPLAKALAGARLLVSGSAALPLPDHRRIEAAAGRPVIERYGMTETLITTAVPVGGPPRTGTVGLPLRGMELRLVDEAGAELGAWDGETVGEIQLRGPSLFTGYLGRPDATAAAFAPGGWFRTGDLAAREPDGAVRIVGRRATDLIKSGGYKIGAGEVENALLDHPGVREAAVTGEPDPDLGERIVAWVVPVDPAAPPAADALADHVARELSPHKRPRTVRFMDSLPRNEMGKIMKRALGSHE